jgi:lysophospholipase
LVVLIHGFAEHSGRYAHVIEALNQAGLSVLAIDLRGHGNSEGKRGHIERFKDYIDDVETAIQLAAQVQPDASVYLLGHSMGGLVVGQYVLHHPEGIAGCVMSSPALSFSVKIPAWKSALGKGMSRIFPTLGLATGLDTQDLTHDTAMVAAYEKDPLVFKKATSRWFTEMLEAQQEIFAEAPNMSTPLLMQVAGDDRLVSAETSREFHDRYGGEDRTFHYYEHAFHEIYNEVDRDHPIHDLTHWFDTR